MSKTSQSDIRRAHRAAAKPLTDDEAIKMALARFGTYPFRPVSEVARMFGRDPAVVSRAIARAFRERLVQVAAAEKGVERLPRLGELERRILERFEDLAACVVLDQVKAADSPAEDDALHQQLGVAMAELIATGLPFRDGDIVGVGSGRGVYQTIRGLARFPPIRASVSLMSLTGAVYARDHSEQMNFLLDADVHLGLLGLQVARPVRLFPLSHPIVARSPGEAEAHLAQTHLGKDHWATHRPTHGLLGLGVLSDGQQYRREVLSDPNKRTTLLQPIYRYLEPLVKTSDAIARDHNYCPVADVCNRLFLVEPPSAAGLSPKAISTLRARIGPLLKSINQHLVTLTEQQLKDIPAIMLIAGTATKGPAIRTLLMSGVRVRFLCTDRFAAQQILSD